VLALLQEAGIWACSFFVVDRPNRKNELVSKCVTRKGAADLVGL